MKKEDLQALAERQYQIGSIHSRIGIPAEAVPRGARQIKSGLVEAIRDSQAARDTGIAAIHYAISGDEYGGGDDVSRLYAVALSGYQK
ncbi:hypothetical protein LNP17_03980 [Klebsiella variicola subsp. variicola]|nr:hypothetical protein [Klebsiella variicola subsp. variicola]